MCLHCIIYVVSEEDVSTLKSSLYLLKKISLNIKKFKSYEKLIDPVIRLILVATSRILSNSEILEDKLREVKENVTNCLKDTLTNITITKTKFGNFILQHKVHGKSETQVRYNLIAY